ncbi:MAG: hypothetical protein CMO59_11305 [Verrucomicrobiales bacterium]|nr:hypothetical protein [Verrucomicrobiales bacterium]
MGINQDSSQEDESFISSDDGNKDGSSINWTEINFTDENEIDDLAEVTITNNIKEPIEALKFNSPLTGNEPVDLTSSNQIEVNEVKPFQTEKAEKDFFDKSNLVSVDEYREGKTKVSPLEGRRVGNRTGLEENPNFLSGRFPKFLERGLPYPEPGKLVFTSILVLMTRFSLIATLVILPLSLYVNTTEFGLWVVLPVVSSFLLLCIIHFVATQQTRCRVCSCHLYRSRRCDKHRLAHRLPLLGYVFGSALHLILFRWMRCMYCGTAIRLRQKTVREEKAEES